MDSFIKKVFRSDFTRDISTLVSGTALAQLIPILIQPIIRRYYPAELFGTYAVYISLIGIFYIVSSLRYEQAIVLPDNDAEACNIFTLSQIINLFISFTIAIVIIFFKDSVIALLNIPLEHHYFLLLLPISIFLFNMQQAIALWLTRKKNFKTISVAKLIRRSSEGGIQLGFSFTGKSFGLIIGDLLGHTCNNIYGISRVFKTGFSFQQLSFRKIRFVSKKYKEYPKYNTWSTLLNAFSIMLPVIFINKFYGAHEAAHFDLSRLVLLSPIALVAGAISNVMLQRISHKKQNKSLFNSEIKMVLILGLLIAILEMIAIMFFGEPLFQLLFGEQYRFSGKISKILLWPYLLYFFTFSLTSTFLALREIKLLSIFQLSSFLFAISLIFFRNLVFIDFLKVIVIFNAINTLVFVGLYWHVINKYKKLVLPK